MKRYGYIYEDIIDINNCRKAIIEASKSKRNKSYVKNILNNIDFYAEDLSKRFQTLNFTSPYRIKEIQDGASKKKRIIQIPKYYPDQCAHHAIVQVLQPIITKSSYYYSCANMPKRGLSRAQLAAIKASNLKYCAKTDIKKFYPSINNGKLKIFIRKKLKDKKAIEILDVVIDSCKGLPIGYYTSPWLAEWHSQDLDHYIKENLKIKEYSRYADDQVLADNNKRKLSRATKSVIQYVKKKYGLTIKSNYQVFPIYHKNKYEKKGYGRKIDYVGVCYANGFRTIRKRRALVIMKQSRLIDKLIKRDCQLNSHLCNSYMSRTAAFKQADSFGMKKKYYKHVSQIKNVIRRNSKCLLNQNQIVSQSY